MRQDSIQCGENVIAIDGPAGAGKSTLSRGLAEHLGLERLDTGAMYRAVTAAALSRGIALNNKSELALIAKDADIEVGDSVWIDGQDVTQIIRSPEVGMAVSSVAAISEVRSELVTRQRDWARVRGGGVVEGRDIGSVVFPDARLKVHLTASLQARTHRRIEEPAQALKRRDQIDSSREASPLVVANGAHIIDTTNRSIEEVLKEVLSYI